MEDYEKKYKEALGRANAKIETYNHLGNASVVKSICEIFPELKESEDEKIRNTLIDLFKNRLTYYGTEKLKDLKVDDILAWLEKQGNHKSLYIRFGDIPSNEKSKIYRGEEEISEEDGVSVYPAFEVDGNVVLGLTLPITKTTLYTQQHLLEYDNRPCYLVSGDYVGKGADGEPLIKNVSVIKQLNNYRIKEINKQREQKPILDFKAKDWYVSKVDGKIHNIYHSVDKDEPKFKVGDWITNGEYTWKVTDIKPLDYILQSQNGDVVNDTISYVDEEFHLWTIQDTKDGDVLHKVGFSSDCIFIFNSIEDGSASDDYYYRHFIKRMQDAFIDKACEWLKDNGRNYHSAYTTEDMLIEDFKKAMQEGEV